MNYSLVTLNDFSTLFSGNNEHHGVYIPNATPDAPGVKVGGTAFQKAESVTTDLYEKHLNGTQGLGIVPIRSDSTCSFSVLDVDVYGKDHTQILKTIREQGVPLLPFRSKSGGLHLYAFYSKPVKAADARALMERLKSVLMLDTYSHKSTEVFPKQDILEEGGCGNYINLPYFNAVGVTKQYLIGIDGKAVDIDEAISYIRQHMYTIEQYEKAISNLALSDAPPCLQALYISGVAGNRNKYLFSLGCYYKNKYGDEFERYLSAANNRLDDPVELKELVSTCITSLKKKDYQYVCKEEPLCGLCSSKECKKRKYGITSPDAPNLTYEELLQYGEEEPYYEWKVNGKKLTFYSVKELLSQDSFIEKAVCALHLVPYKLTQAKWTEILNNAMSNVEVVKAVVGEGLGIHDVFMLHLSTFLCSHSPAQNKEQILDDRVYRDTDVSSITYNHYLFRPTPFWFYLKQQQFTTYSQAEVQCKLKALGACPSRISVRGMREPLRAWSIPCSVVAAAYEEKEAAGRVAVDFSQVDGSTDFSPYEHDQTNPNNVTEF